EAEILEGTEQASLERGPEPKLGRDAPVEPAADVLAVGPLGRRGEPEQEPRPQMGEQSLVRTRLCVVHFVHDNDLECIWTQRIEVNPRECLDGSEDVLAPHRSLALRPELAEASVAQHRAKRAAALVQDLPAMCHKEEPRLAPRPPHASVVERGNDRLAGPRRGHHEILPTRVEVALGRQPVEYLLLVGVRIHVERDQLERGFRALYLPRTLESLAVACGVVGLKLSVLPVAIESRLELLEHL